MGDHGCDAHDVVDPALEPGLVVAVLGPEGVNVLGYATLRGVDRVHLFAVTVPHDLGQRIATSGLAGEHHLVSTTKRLAVHVALDVGRTRGI